ncbi:MAG: NAD-dependent dihydropyrimidine dehydrogenase subunit PreA, partial [Deltaproteobacteria bacterium]|nr:NAD-dependent dihydropyrimidine dehydrogenase subunit PreA [Deltaproteobacteria bacterium]
MSDLNVNFCGFNLINPFLLASAPPTGTGAMMRRAYQAGWAGGVTKTLVVDASTVNNVSPRLASLSYPGHSGQPRKIFALMNIELVTDRSLETWLKEIQSLTEEFPDRMTIASIMDDASKPDGWQNLAK